MSTVLDPTDPREGLLPIAEFLDGHKGQLPYTEGAQRMEGERMTWIQVMARLRSGGTITGDCSGMVSDMFDWAGLRDPNGLGFDGFGFTGTVMDHLPRFTDTADVHLGTIGVYGTYPGVHEIMFLEDYQGDQTRIFSHGGPYGAISTLGVENSYHAGKPLGFYAIAGLLPAAARSMHYDRFDATRIHLSGHLVKVSERAVVERYDSLIGHPDRNKIALAGVHVELVALLKRVEANSQLPPGPDADFRHWRTAQIALRVQRKIVKPS